MKKNTSLHHSVQQQWICFSVYLISMLLLITIAKIFSERRIIFFILLSVAGFLGWTYLEYHLHRFWTHNKTSKSTKGAYKRHIHHHQHPTEIKVTPLQRIILFILSAIQFILSARWNNYFTFFSSFFIGFAYSFFSHWMLHQSWSGKIFPRLLRFHICHHSKYPDSCFGFSTTLWDDIFRTTPPKEVVITERIIRFYYGEEDHYHSINNS